MAYGLVKSWRFSFDRETGELWIGLRWRMGRINRVAQDEALLITAGGAAKAMNH